jgi:hypothetical protein
MERGIRLTKIWCDDDLVELEITVADGSSRFVNRVYVGHQDLADAVSQLDTFKNQVHGGITDLRFGQRGPEYAMGAFHARFHFPKPGRLHITCCQESDFAEFGLKTVASSATLYLRSEPALLDSFITQLNWLMSGEQSSAQLDAV